MKRTKKTLCAGIALALGAVLCSGALVACDGDKEPTSPEHVAAISADCTHAGNVEYWTRDGKYYADEGCTVELESIVDPAKGHDFAGGGYGKDYSGHWKVCAREGCGATDTAAEHDYVDGVCICGYTEQSVPVTYAITVSDGIVNGEVTASAATAEAGATITLTVTPDSGYELTALAYNGTDIDITGDTYTFEMPAAAVTVTATFELTSEPPVPQKRHFEANAPDCTTNGNIEYWTLGGKYYSDEECTEEITEADTVDPKLGHDFDNGEYGKGDDNHWKICAREGCDATSEPEAHDFNRDDEHGRCVCGKTNNFEGYSLFAYSENDADLGVTREDTANSVKISAATPDGEGWHIKFENEISGIKLGHYYEATYVLTSDIAGTVRFETNGAYYKRDAQLVVGENTVKFRFAVGEVHDVDKTNINLQLGALSSSQAFNVEIKSAACAEVDYDPNEYNLDTPDNVVAANKTVNDDKSITVATDGGDGVDWHLKLARDITVESGKTYELVIVLKRTSGKDENMVFEVYDNVVTYLAYGDEDDYGKRARWIDSDGVQIVKYKFTANESVTKGCCLSIGNLTDANNPLELTFYYIGLEKVSA